MPLPYLMPNLISVRGEPQPTEKYQAAIFFDNDHAKILQVASLCPKIKGITVPETPGSSGPGQSARLSVKYTDEPIKSIISESGGENNFYIKIARATGINDELYDPVSGISPEHVRQLADWLSETASMNPRAVLLDWDRTITKAEGVLLPSTRYPTAPISSMFGHITNTGGKTETDFIEDMLKIICGGPARLAMLREMFNIIRDSGAHLIIITNNDLCFTASYKQLVDGLIPNPGPPIYLACSKNPPFLGDKGYRLKSNSLFNIICSSEPVAGGAGSVIASKNSNSSLLPLTKRKFVNLTGNNENENLYRGGKRMTKKNRRRHKRRTNRRGKVRKN